MTLYFRPTVLIFAIIFFSYGCASTKRISPGEELSIDKRATIVWKNNGKTAAHHVLVQGDSIIAWEYTSPYERIAHIAEVQYIVVNNHGKGAIQGIMMGAMAGAAFGVGINALFSGNLYYYAKEGMKDGAPFGAFPGVLYGGIVGSKTRYIFEPPITSAPSLATSAPSLAENTYKGVENRPIPQSIQTGGDAPNNPDQESISEIDLVRARAPVYLGPPFQMGLQLFGRPAGGIYESTSGFSMNWYSDRQFSTISDLTHHLPGNPHRYYINFGLLIIDGRGSAENVYVVRNIGLTNVSLGIEGFRVGTAHSGRLRFFELGLIYGDGREYFYDDRQAVYYDGLGVVTAGGMRWYKRSLLAEAKIAINSKGRHLFPSLLVGYRF